MHESSNEISPKTSLFDDLYDYELGKVRELITAQVTRFHSSPAKGSMYYPILNPGNLDDLDNLSVRIRRRALEETTPRISDLLILMLFRSNTPSSDERILPMYGSLEEPQMGFLSTDLFPVPQFAIKRGESVTGYYCSSICESPARLTSIAKLAKIRKQIGEIEEDVRQGIVVPGFLKRIQSNTRLFPVDSIVNIVLSNSSGDEIMRTRVERCNEDAEKRERDVQVRYILLNDFLRQHFGEDEQRHFEERIDELNDELRNVVSLNTIAAPTPLTIEGMRRDLAAELSDNKGTLRDELKDLGFGPSQIDRVFSNFFDRGLINAMVGHRAFADSLMTSEWLRGINKITSSLDQTGTIVGYLKSIEQLLFDVAMLSFNMGREMPVHWNEREKQLETSPFDDGHFDADELEKLNLWQLSNYFDPRNNQGLLDIDLSAGQKLQNLLKEFRKNSRNGYLHKDNLHDDGATEVDRIRHQTLLLHVLILGGCKIEDSDLSSIGAFQNLSEQTLSEDEATNARDFEEWVTDELSNPVVQCLLTAPGSALLFRIHNDLMVDTIQDFVDGKRTAWVIDVSVENPLPALTQEILSGTPTYKGKSRFEWKRSCSRALTISEVSQWLKSIDWEAILSPKTGLPPIVLDFSNIHRTTIV